MTIIRLFTGQTQNWEWRTELSAGPSGLATRTVKIYEYDQYYSLYTHHHIYIGDGVYTDIFILGLYAGSVYVQI